MDALPVIDLAPREKLRLLRRLDLRHEWLSLRDERFCPMCRETFAGTDVEIVGGTRGFGPLRLQCPTAGCRAGADCWAAAESTTHDWLARAQTLLRRLHVWSPRHQESVIAHVPR